MAESDGSFSIGSDVWAGLSKLIEECGEVIQVAGKLIGTHGKTEHWDGAGDLAERLIEEMGDVLAAIVFVVDRNDLSALHVHARAANKLAVFSQWHKEQQAA